MIQALQNVKNKEDASCVHTEPSVIKELHEELAKGIQSMKNGEVYTIEDAWKEIDKI